MNTKEKLAICVIVLQTVIIMILLAILNFFGISKIKEIINKLTNGTGIIAIIFRVISMLIRMCKFLQKIFAKLKTGIKDMILGMRNVIQKILAKLQTGIKVLQNCIKALETGVKDMFLGMGRFFQNIFSKLRSLLPNLTSIKAFQTGVKDMFLGMGRFFQNIFSKLRSLLPNRTGIKDMSNFGKGAQLLAQARSSNNGSVKNSLATEALALAEKAIELDPKDAASHLLKAMVLDFQGFSTSSLECLNAAALFSVADGERGDVQAQFKRDELEPQLSVPEVVNRKRMVEFEELPEGCIAKILSRTTPVDACRLSLVSKTFRSASNSDDVWTRFLPSNSNFIASIISHSPSLANAPTRKALYQALSDRPIIIDNAQKSFQLDRKSGKKCYMLAARSLSIIWVDNQQYWNWTAMPESRFPEVAKLRNVCWLEIHGMINTLSLSINTQYVAYLVFKMIDARGFHNRPIELLVGVEGGHISTKTVCFDPNVEGRPHNREVGLQRHSVRSDGWLEIEMGEFFNSGLVDEEVKMSVREVRSGYWKSGLVVEGIEVRPK